MGLYTLRTIMQNIFKQQISNQLYNDILTVYGDMNDTSFHKNKIENEINKKEKYQKVAMIASGSLGLLSVGMMALNYFDNHQFSQEAIRSSAAVAIAFVSINTTLASTLNRLRSSRNLQHFDKKSSQLNYDEFERRLIKDLKSYGIQAKYKEVITQQDHNDLSDTWKTSDKQDLITDLRNKTTNYVKLLIDTYVEPELMKSSYLDREYIKRMLDGPSENRHEDISSVPYRKPKKNTP